MRSLIEVYLIYRGVISYMINLPSVVCYVIMSGKLVMCGRGLLWIYILPL